MCVGTCSDDSSAHACHANKSSKQTTRATTPTIPTKTTLHFRFMTVFDAPGLYASELRECVVYAYMHEHIHICMYVHIWSIMYDTRLQCVCILIFLFCSASHLIRSAILLSLPLPKELKLWSPLLHKRCIKYIPVHTYVYA